MTDVKLKAWKELLDRAANVAAAEPVFQSDPSAVAAATALRVSFDEMIDLDNYIDYLMVNMFS